MKKKQTIILSVITLLALILSGCAGKKTFSIYDISELRKGAPESVTIYPDDPSATSVEVKDAAAISKILSYYAARKYYERKSGAPVPGSNAHIEFHYKDSVTVKLPVEGFEDYDLAERDGLGNYIEQLRGKK